MAHNRLIKLVKRIQAGDMSELLPDYFTSPGDKANQVKASGQYLGMGIVSSQQFALKSIQDMLGNLALTVEAQMEYEDDGYDCYFRQNTATSPDTTWAKIDPSLWNIAFVGLAKVSRSKHCFSLTHSAADCNWGPCPSTSPSPISNPMAIENLL